MPDTTQHSPGEQVNPVDIAEHADRLFEAHPYWYERGRRMAGRRTAVGVKIPAHQARRICAERIERGLDDMAAYWLGYADEMQTRCPS